MFFWIVISLVAIVFLGFLAVAVFDKDPGALAGAVASFVVGAIIFVLFSITTVDARSVAIQTSFGQYQSTLDNGLHFVAPWSSTEEFSTQVQDLDLEVPVSFDGGSSGTVNITVLWAIDADDAQELWQDWKTFDRVRDRLVKPAGQTAIAAAFSGYSPEDARNGGNRDDIQTIVFDSLEANLNGRGVDVDSIQITNVTLGDRAQNSVDRIAEAAANTQRAIEEQERASIEAETARIRQETLTPEALTRYCLEVLNSWSVGNNGEIPATLNCNLVGGSQTPVIVGP